MACRFVLNNASIEEHVPADALLLDIIRRNRGMTGTKEACREGDCGACQILSGELINNRIRYQAVNACLVPAGAITGRHVVSIEGLNSEQLSPIQRALVDNGAIQCGFCTPGLVIALTGFFLNSRLSDENAALDSVAGNLCRCTGYAGIKRAVSALCRQFDLSASPLERRIEDLIAWQILPAYFSTAPGMLRHVHEITYAFHSPHPSPLQQERELVVEVIPCAFLSQYQVGKASEPLEHAILIGGGTDLFVQKPEQLHSQALYFLSNESLYPLIRKAQSDLIINALTTIEQIRTSELLQAFFPRLAEDFKLICSAPIRQRATLAGNLVNASPIADLAVFFLALAAQLTLVSGSETRIVSLQNFFQGYKKIDLKPGERLLEISFEIPGKADRFNYEKVSKRTHLDIASVNSAMLIQEQAGKINKVHLSAGGVAPVPLYLAKTCAYLRGQTVCLATVKTAAEIAQTEIAPISDIRGSAQYKRLLLRQLLYAHFAELFPGVFEGGTFNAG
ncbi:MAG: molybdopterin dehydrogenase [Methylobacter sp.]|nr:MAG: molybdopterin dehydrogenase [Methylobacter sp.]